MTFRGTKTLDAYFLLKGVDLSEPIAAIFEDNFASHRDGNLQRTGRLKIPLLITQRVYGETIQV